MSASTSASTSANNYTSANNLSDRAILLSTGIKNVVPIGTFTGYTPGSRANIKVRNVGVTTGFFVRVTASITIATAAATASPFAPYTTLSKIEFSDYNTTLRQSSSGILNYFMNSIRYGRPFLPTGQGNVDTQQTVTPTAVGADQLLQYSFYVPLARDPNRDLTGAVLSQTVVGEQYLNLTVNPTVVGDVTSPYTATTGDVTINSVSFQVWQEYILPQTPNLPLMDLNTVYEFNGLFTSTNNVSTNGQAFIDYPNVRNVLGMYYGLVNNGGVTVNGGDITNISLIANGNTNIRDRDPLSVRATMRHIMGGDLPAGLYYDGHRNNPVSTFIYSQFQMRLTFGTLAGNSYLFYGFESIYPNNTPLPGVGLA